MGYGPCGEVLQVATHLPSESARAAVEISNAAKKKTMRFIRSILMPHILRLSRKRCFENLVAPFDLMSSLFVIRLQEKCR